MSCTASSTKHKLATEKCNTLSHCLTILESIEPSQYGLSIQEKAFAELFTRFGEPALKELLQRLDLGDNRSKIAGYAISRFGSIDEKYLPQIVEGVKNNIASLASALGNIPTAQAAKTTVDLFLTSQSAPNNQVANALKKQGKRAVPFILQRMQCGSYCEGIRPGLLVYSIGAMDAATRAYAAKAIIKRLHQSDISLANQANLLALFFNMDTPGLVAEKGLERLARKHPKLIPQIDKAYVGIRSKHSGRVFAEWIRQYPNNTLLLRDVAELGPTAKDAGPAVMALLRSPSSEVQVAAARALGFLQYKPASQALMNTFKNTLNAQLHWVAANSLGRLGQTSAIPFLQKIADEHWYIAVKQEAMRAIKHIQQGNAYSPHFHKSNFAFDFFKYQHPSIESCQQVTLKKIPPDPKNKLLRNRDLPALQALTYDSYIIGYTAADEEEQRAENPDGIVIINQNTAVEVREERKKTPNVAIRVKNGWLTGYDGGEWGGDLRFQAKSGDAQQLLNNNVENLFKFGTGYIALTGLSHLMMNEGMVYRVFNVDGQWRVTPWVTLPGAPIDSWRTETGEILIDTYSGGSILLAEDGKLRMAPCKDDN